MESHLKRLLDKHLKLDRKIQQDEHVSANNDLYIHKLKKQKLRLKEEIERLKLFTGAVKAPDYLNNTIIKVR